MGCDMGQENLKMTNMNRVYQYIHENGYATKQDLSTELNLSLPTITQNINYFIEAGIVEAGKKVSSGANGGRNPIAYSIVEKARYGLGVDITKNHIKLIALDLNGDTVHYVYKAKAYQRTDTYLEEISEELKRFRESVGIDKDKVLGVGIAVPSLLDEENRKVIYGKVIDNEGMHIDDFAKHLPYPAHLIHDSEAAGFAEFWSNEEASNAFYVSLNNSVGGSVFIDGKLYRGDGIYAGEIGHLKMSETGERCYCGQIGCFDVFCNATVLSRATDGSLDRFFQALQADDPKALAVWSQYLKTLIRGLHDIRTLFGGQIIIGGDVAEFLEPFMDEIYRRVNERVFKEEDSRTYLSLGVMKKEAVVKGAALTFIDAFTQNPVASLESLETEEEA